MEIMKKDEDPKPSIVLTKHFELSEIVCRKNMQICPYCGGELPPEEYWTRVTDTLKILEKVREYFQNILAYVLITSAYRCKKYNDEISTCKTPDLSQHRIFAVDFQVIQLTYALKRNVPAMDIYNLLNFLMPASIGGIGIIDDISVHFDLRESNPWRRNKKY